MALDTTAKTLKGCFHTLWLSKTWMEAIINETVHLSALCTPLVSSMLLSPLLICPWHNVRLEPVQCKRTGAGTVKLHWKTVGNCVRVMRNKYLLEYVLIVQRGWKGLFLLCPLIPSPKCIISRIECTDDLLTLFGILKEPEPICQELFGIESALIPFCLQKS